MSCALRVRGFAVCFSTVGDKSILRSYRGKPNFLGLGRGAFLAKMPVGCVENLKAMPCHQSPPTTEYEELDLLLASSLLNYRVALYDAQLQDMPLSLAWFSSHVVISILSTPYGYVLYSIPIIFEGIYGVKVFDFISNIHCRICDSSIPSMKG